MVRLGLNGYWGNKGTVSVRFNLYGVSLCVLNSHLAAHDHQNQVQFLSHRIINSFPQLLKCTIKTRFVISDMLNQTNKTGFNIMACTFLYSQKTGYNIGYKVFFRLRTSSVYANLSWIFSRSREQSYTLKNPAQDGSLFYVYLLYYFILLKSNILCI